MNQFEQDCFDRRDFPPRSFAHFDPATGEIKSVTHCQIGTEYPDLVTAVFDNVDWSVAAMPGYRVDLSSVRVVEGDYQHCELTGEPEQLQSPLPVTMILPDMRNENG